ncbi:protein SICKLE isoform X2 [Arachis stenosperma]|uniref:protein SICKLE isoform X2 n=1 Tax=Arachis stenosperma TaxID=217475 RepID=UPI0025AD8F14|nr:protein SICKLE isoform X2 [Arachis stenosperma]
MEDSEQRKKRLKEMRMQADQAEVSGGVEGSGIPGHLSNPLIETSSTSRSQDRSSAAPRFDFYTDPMNAFSSNRMNNPRMQSAPDYFPLANFARSPAVQDPGSTNLYMAASATQASPTPYRNPGGPSCFAGQGIIPHPSHSLNPSPGYRNSPTPNRGRGRGIWHNTQSHASGRCREQGLTSHGHWSNKDRASGPEDFYKRSMVEDPWKLLSPVIWRTTTISSCTPGSSKPRISNSVSDKREGPSGAAIKTGSEPSLAEYLAAAFNEAAGNAENV